MATYKKRKVEGTVYGKAMQGIAGAYVRRGDKPNRSEWNAVDDSWFTYWCDRATSSDENNARLDAIDEEFILSQTNGVTPKQQTANNDKAAEVAKALGIDPAQAAAFMSLLSK